MHLESWAGFGLTAGLGANAAVAALAPYLLGDEPTETLVAIGLAEGRPALTATWPLASLTDHASYAEPINTWARQCEELYVLVCTEDPERCYDAAEALWYECLPVTDGLREYLTVARSKRGWAPLNTFDRDGRDLPFEDHWSHLSEPHPVLARLFALAWQQALGDAHQIPAPALPALAHGLGSGPIRISDNGRLPWAYAPARVYGIDLTSGADALAEVYDAVWRVAEPELLDIAYWRTTGSEPAAGTAQSLIAGLSAFAQWRKGLYGGAEQAAADAVAADPTSAVARAVARLVHTPPRRALAWAPVGFNSRYSGPGLPVVDVTLHTEIRALADGALDALMDPSVDGRDYRTEIRALRGTTGQLVHEGLEHLADTAEPLAVRRLADIAAADPTRVGLTGVWGVLQLQTWSRTRGTATAVLLDGSGQVLHRSTDADRDTWTAWPSDRTGGWKSEELFRLAHALLRAERS